MTGGDWARSRYECRSTPVVKSEAAHATREPFLGRPGLIGLGQTEDAQNGLTRLSVNRINCFAQMVEIGRLDRKV